jgi:hypothetical protein
MRNTLRSLGYERFNSVSDFFIVVTELASVEEEDVLRFNSVSNFFIIVTEKDGSSQRIPATIQ